MILLLLGCTDYVVHGAKPLPPAEPPGYLLDAHGEPPSDWKTCNSGWYGRYANLPDAIASEPDDDTATPPSIDLSDDSWWDDDWRSFERYDPTLDFGANWWPVDDGIGDDPQFFGVRWTSWLRVDGDSTLQIVLGAMTDAWFLVDDDEIVVDDADEFLPQVYDLGLRGGVHKVDLRYVQRNGTTSGFRFRLVATDRAKLCYPEFDQDE